MLVFIDESGDPGFKVDKGASSTFIAAMMIFRSAEDPGATQLAIERDEARRVHKAEFKFSKCSYDVRDLFFQAVCNCPFMIRVIVIRKDLIYSDRLWTDKENFYEYFAQPDRASQACRESHHLRSHSPSREHRPTEHPCSFLHLETLPVVTDCRVYMGSKGGVSEAKLRGALRLSPR